MKEFWKPIVGYEGFYEISSECRLRSLVDCNGNKLPVPKEKKATIGANGYFAVNLNKKGVQRRHSLHRLYAEAFLPNPLGLPMVNHKDECKTNNFIFFDEGGNAVPEKSNLEWCDCKYNINYGTGIERHAKAMKGKLVNHPKKSKRVLQFDLEGNLIKEWPSIMEVERQTGWSNSGISFVCHGKRKTFHGFVWRHKEA